ncbi:MAG: hypothetical protein U0263_32660 [Polyangiaceae bacterium]
MLLGVTVGPDLLRERERLLRDQRLDRHADPVLPVAHDAGPRVRLPPEVPSDGGFLSDDLEHVIFRPQFPAVAVSALVQLTRRRLGAALVHVGREDFRQCGGLVGFLGEPVPRDSSLVDLLDPEAERGLRAVDEAALGVLEHRGTRAHAVHVRLILVDELEDALDELAHGVVAGLLTDRDDLDAGLAEGVLERAGFAGVTHESAGLVDEHRIDRAGGREHLLHHLPEDGAVLVAAAGAGLDVLGDDLVLVLGAVPPHRVGLGRQAQVAFGLLRRGHPGVQNDVLDFFLGRPAPSHLRLRRCRERARHEGDRRVLEPQVSLPREQGIVTRNVAGDVELPPAWPRSAGTSPIWT